MRRSEITYAVADGHHIAYRVLTGDSGVGQDIVMVNGVNFPMDSLPGDSLANRMLEGLASLGRLVVFDRRGIGLSDPVIDWERPLYLQWEEDLEAVIDAAALDRPTLFSWNFLPVARGFAARHRDAIQQLILFNPFVVPDPDEWNPNEVRDHARAVQEGRATGGELWPTRWHDPGFREWQEAAGRAGASPSQAARLIDAPFRMDWESTAQVSVPTLVLARCPPTNPWGVRDDFFGRAAAQIPGAELVWLPEGDAFPFGVGVDDVLAEISRFITGEVQLPAPERFLAAILFTDLVESTRRVVEVGDRRWKTLLDRHDEISRSLAHRHGGSVIKSTGDGVLATFPSTTAAIDAARAIAHELRSEGLELRAGIHAGQIDRRGDDISGLALSVAARIMAIAEPGQLLVSDIVARITDSVEFESAGEHALKGLDGTWPVYELR